MPRQVIDNRTGLDTQTKQVITDTKEDTTLIQDQLLILMGGIADLYEALIGGDE